jgi:hypothetical protein
MTEGVEVDGRDGKEVVDGSDESEEAEGKEARAEVAEVIWRVVLKIQPRPQEGCDMKPKEHSRNVPRIWAK